MKQDWVKGFALFKKQWGGVYFTGTKKVGVGAGPMWTRSAKRAKIYPSLRAAYDDARNVRELQEASPVRIVGNE
jgi:hypothetical protein